MEPKFGFSSPRIMLMTVVLPAPLLPRRARIWLEAIEREMFSTANVLPKYLDMLKMSRMFVGFRGGGVLVVFVFVFVVFAIFSASAPAVGTEGESASTI